tara:strand:+ start:533 stop:733 length:201 start_codon:yes stop_codon:yes gene_type:complete
MPDSIPALKTTNKRFLIKNDKTPNINHSKQCGFHLVTQASQMFAGTCIFRVYPNKQQHSAPDDAEC